MLVDASLKGMLDAVLISEEDKEEVRGDAMATLLDAFKQGTLARAMMEPEEGEELRRSAKEVLIGAFKQDALMDAMMDEEDKEKVRRDAAATLMTAMQSGMLVGCFQSEQARAEASTGHIPGIDDDPVLRDPLGSSSMRIRNQELIVAFKSEISRKDIEIAHLKELLRSA